MGVLGVVMYLLLGTVQGGFLGSILQVFNLLGSGVFSLLLGFSGWGEVSTGLSFLLFGGGRGSPRLFSSWFDGSKFLPGLFAGSAALILSFEGLSKSFQGNFPRTSPYQDSLLGFGVCLS